MSPDATRAPSRLHAQQSAFAAHLRDPTSASAPDGIEERRLQVYRELFYNNIEGLLANNFPVLRGLREDATWHALVRDFYREHRCHTPLFPQIGREFLRYLEQRQQDQRGDPAWLLELAHYEWVELALALDEQSLDTFACDRDADLLAQVPVPSPLAWPLAYRWPVERIGAAWQPDDTVPDTPTFLLVLRDRNDDVRFKQIDALAYTLLQALHANIAQPEGERLDGRALLANLAATHGITDTDTFITSGATLLHALRDRDAILGAI